MFMYSFIGMTCVSYTSQNPKAGFQPWTGHYKFGWTCRKTNTCGSELHRLHKLFLCKDFEQMPSVSATQKRQRRRDKSRMQLNSNFTVWSVENFLNFKSIGFKAKITPPKEKITWSYHLYLYSVTPTISHRLTPIDFGVQEMKKAWCIYHYLPIPSHLFLPCFYPPRFSPNCRCTQHKSAQDPAISWQEEENGWPLIGNSLSKAVPVWAFGG